MARDMGRPVQLFGGVAVSSDASLKVLHDPSSPSWPLIEDDSEASTVRSQVWVVAVTAGASQVFTSQLYIHGHRRPWQTQKAPGFVGR